MAGASRLSNPPSLAEWCLVDRPETPWLVPGLISQGGLTLLSGPAKKAYKTWFALHSAIAIANDRHLGGHKPRTTGSVLFIEEEGSDTDLENRVRGVCRGLDVQVNALTRIAWLFRQRVKLDNMADRRDLLSLLADKPDCKLVVFDTLSRVFNGDENNAKEVNAAVETIMRINDTGAAVLLLAHLRKDWTRASDIDEQIRGSGHIAASYDTHVALRPSATAASDPKHVVLNATVRPRVEGEREATVRVNFDQNALGELVNTIGVTFDTDSETRGNDALDSMLNDLDVTVSVRRKKKNLFEEE